QGIEFDSKTLWVTSVDAASRKGFLHKFSMDSGAMLQSAEVQDDERFHPGGIAAEGGALWIPVAEYRANSTSIIQKRDKVTLKVMYQFRVADHIGCLAVTSQYIIGGNWDSREFYFWDRKGNLIRKISSDTNNAYQDIKFDPPYLVASGLLSDHTGAVDWLELPSLHLLRRGPAGPTDRQAPLSRGGKGVHNNHAIFFTEGSSH